MRQPSLSGPASTVSKPNASSILVTVAFALSSGAGRSAPRAVVARDDESAPVRGTGGLAIRHELGRADVVERLDHLRLRKVRLQQLGGRRRLVVELGDVPVTLRIVVVRVDNDLACEGLDRNAPVVLERDRDVSARCQRTRKQQQRGSSDLLRERERLEPNRLGL
jgi:hypothetical protein